MKHKEFLEALDRCFGEGRVSDAEAMLFTALNRAKAQHSMQDELMICNELIGFCRVMTRFREGADYARQAMILIDQLDIHETETEATTYINYATLMLQAGDKDKAQHLFQKASDIMKHASCDLYTKAGFFNNLAGLLLQNGQHEKALLYIDTALELLAYIDHMADQKGVSLTTRAQIRAGLGQYEAAIADLNEALESFSSIPDASITHVAIAYYTFGEIYLKMKETRKAKAAYLKAKEHILRLGDTSHLRMIEQKLKLCMA